MDSLKSESRATGSEILSAILTPEQQAHLAAGLNRTVTAVAERVVLPLAEQFTAALGRGLAPIGQAVADYVNSPQGRRTLQSLQSFEQRDTAAQGQAAAVRRLYEDGRANMANLVYRGTARH